MEKDSKVAVCSRSLSKNEQLRKVLLERYTQVKFNDDGLSLDEDSLIEFIKDQNKIIIGLEKINESVLDSCPNLEVISKYGVGLDNLDLNALRKRKIKLGWKGGVNKRSGSEMALCLIIMMIRRVNEGIEDVKNGEWNQVKGSLLSHKSIGILGFGNIGMDLYELLKPFGCNILVYDTLEIEKKLLNVKQVEIDEVLKLSDVVSIHLPFNDSTKNLIDMKRLSLMKKTSILINLSRGGIVVEKDLKKVLENKSIAAAAMDVFKTEPPEDNNLISLKNFIATPHMGGISLEGIHDMGMAAINGLEENKIPE